MDFNSVLLVDDDPTQIAILSAYFGAAGVSNIHSAGDPAAALEILSMNRGAIDLIVSDLQMPRMDGLEFLRHLRSLNFSGKLAIFSGVGNDLLIHAGRLAKMHNLNLIGQLNKPISKDALDSVFLNFERKEVLETSPSEKVIVTQEEFSHALYNGEIRPFYQPKVDVLTGRIIGAESLARWDKPGAGLVAPTHFVEFAEKNGRIDDLTFQLYKQVLTDVQTFIRHDENHKLAINLSPAMLHNVSLPDRLQGLMKEAGISAKNISFEVTENSILNLDTTTLEVLSRLRIHGFAVAIDDFGTGSSNIQTLRDFPYSELKVDRSFVTRAYENEFSAQTISAAVSFAKQMNMHTVAEGVEDEAEWEFVKRAGIDQVQGFMVSKALSPLAYLDFLSKYEAGLERVAESYTHPTQRM
ncbi:MAG: EAL domain-containing response regulator [Pseudomonadota bacterium]